MARSTMKEILSSRGRGIFLWIFMLVWSIGLVMKLLPNVTTRIFASSLNHTTFQNTDCRGQIHIDDPICRAAQSKSGTWMSVVSGLSAVVTFFITPMVGSLSDIYGRTKFLMLGCFLGLLPFSILTFVYIFPDSSLFTLHLFYIASIAGGGIANFGLAVGLMYIADFFKPIHRAVVFALFLATVDLVLAGAPILGVRLYEINQILPWIVGSVFAVGTVIIAYVIPEAERYNVHKQDTNNNRNRNNRNNRSNRNKNTTKQDVHKTLIDVAAVDTLSSGDPPMSPRLAPWSPGSRSRVDRAKQDVQDCRECRSCAFNPFKALKILNRSNFFRFLAMVSFFQSFIVSGMSIITTYVQLYVLKMTLVEVSNANAIFAITGVVVQVALVQPLIKCIGMRKLMHLGNFALVVGVFVNLFIIWSITIGSCTNGMPTNNTTQSNSNQNSAMSTSADACIGKHQIWTPRMSNASGIFWYILNNTISQSLAMTTFPAISALKANEVSRDEQGGTLGALWSTRSLANVLSPFLFGWMWHKYGVDQVWLIYVVASGVATLAFVSGLFVPKPVIGNEYGEANEDMNVATEEDGEDGNGGGDNELSDPLL